MTRSDVYEEFKFYTGKASDVVRQLALAGFAVVWLFKQDTKAGPTIPRDFKSALVFLLLALLFDFLHYSVASVVWERYKDELSHRPATGVNEDVQSPPSVYYPGAFFYYSKIVTLAIAYGVLLWEIGASHSIFA